ncbi:hypothetical protein [Gallaecimonas sp. GXIMD4217]|uniref:hypothetical protein n=1 Tax=Gallaecimonas sp. GXIMD4217 TaxID=3131927 RepID=UPI00311AE4AE
MEKKKWYQSPEMIIGLSALLVSLVAVFVGVYSAYIDRAYARASVWPRLELYRSFSLNRAAAPEKAQGDSAQADSRREEYGAFSYGVANNGTGPALIKYVKVTYDGKPLKTWQELMRNLVGNSNQISQSHVGGRTLPAQQSITPLSTTNQEFIAAYLDTESERLSVDICYCSIYDECWTVDKENKPKAIEACPDDEDRFLQ